MEQPTPHGVVKRFYRVTKNLHALDKDKIYRVIDSQLACSDRELTIANVYRRVHANIRSLLKLKEARDFQGTVNISRSIFELALDLEVIHQNLVPNAEKKVRLFSDVEKLRVARDIFNFTARNPNVNLNTESYEKFISKRGKELDEESMRVWGKSRSGNPKKIFHWSNWNIRTRAEKVGDPFETWYWERYATFSWYTHSGLTGFNLRAETFVVLQALALHLAADSYKQSLEITGREFKLTQADQDFYKDIEFAYMLAWSESPEQATQLKREIYGR